MGRVDDIIDKAIQRNDGVETGPGHIVLSDGNVTDGHIRYCLALVDALECVTHPNLWDSETREYVRVIFNQFVIAPAESNYWFKFDFNRWAEWYWDDDSILKVTRWALEELLKIPEDKRILESQED